MKGHILVSDEAWIALARLHRANPGRVSFSIREILDQVRAERAHPVLRPGVQWHISLHNVANLPPNPATYRMFFKLPDGTYRLYRPGDPTAPGRNGKTHPRRDQLSAPYQELIGWWETEYCAGAKEEPEQDPMLVMFGADADLWAGVDADAYVRDLRSDWYGAQQSPGPNDDLEHARSNAERT